MSYYQENAKEYFDATCQVDLSGLYESFLKQIPAGGQILDAGCGSGRDLKVFSERGYQAQGFDASARLVELAREYSGTEVRHLTFAEADYPTVFDGIWCCASLLHVRKSDVGSTISSLGRSLKSGGVFYMSFKLGEGERFVGERWFNFYTPETLSSMLEEETGFTAQKVWVTSDARPQQSQEWVNCIASKQQIEREG